MLTLTAVFIHATIPSIAFFESVWKNAIFTTVITASVAVVYAERNPAKLSLLCAA